MLTVNHSTQPTLTGTHTMLKHLWLEITEKCNLTCIHCYADSGPHLPLTNGMHVEHWKRVIREAKAMGCDSLQFIGGEPTIHPELDLLVEEAYNVGLQKIEVFTNGTNMPEKRISNYLRWNIGVAVSFYSDRPATHDGITQRKGSYLKTVNFIERAVAAGLDLRVGIIQLNQTDDEIAAAMTLLRELGVRDISTDKVRGVGRGQDRMPGNQDNNPLSHLCGNCFDGRLCITSSGKAYPCIMARHALLGDIFTDTLKDIVKGAKRTEFVSDQIQYLGGIPAESFINCNPSQGGTCVPQMGNCSPNESKLFDSILNHGDAACNPSQGGTCVPQMGNCSPNENKRKSTLTQGIG